MAQDDSPSYEDLSDLLWPPTATNLWDDLEHSGSVEQTETGFTYLRLSPAWQAIRGALVDQVRNVTEGSDWLREQRFRFLEDPQSEILGEEYQWMWLSPPSSLGLHISLTDTGTNETDPFWLMKLAKGSTSVSFRIEDFGTENESDTTTAKDLETVHFYPFTLFPRRKPIYFTGSSPASLQIVPLVWAVLPVHLKSKVGPSTPHISVALYAAVRVKRPPPKFHGLILNTPYPSSSRSSSSSVVEVNTPTQASRRSLSLHSRRRDGGQETVLHRSSRLDWGKKE